MVSIKKTIAKNAGVLMSSQLIMWSLSLVLTIFLPRYLGAAGIGQLHFADSLWIIAGVFVAFGASTLMTKEIARDPSRTASLFGTTLVLRTLFFLLVYVVLIGALKLFNYRADTIIVVGIVGIASLVWQYANACQAALQGVEQMEWVSLASISSKIIYTVVAVMLLLAGAGVFIIAALLLVSAFISLGIQLFFLLRIQPLRFTFSSQTAITMLRASTPYFLSGLFLVVYAQIDVIFISAYLNEEAVGWYGAADRLFATFLFIPAALTLAAFPAFSRMFLSDPDPLKKLMSKSFDMLLLIGVPLGLGLLSIADPLVILLFGPEFEQSGTILAVFGIVLILTFQNILLGKFLISIDKQNIWTAVMAIATVITIFLDILLIPLCEALIGNGAVGGALAFVITESILLISALLLLPSGTLGRANVSVAARILLAGAIMLFAVWPIRAMFIGIPILVGAGVYLGLIALFRVVPKEDISLVKSLIKQPRAQQTHAQPEQQDEPIEASDLIEAREPIESREPIEMSDPIEEQDQAKTPALVEAIGD